MKKLGIGMHSYGMQWGAKDGRPRFHDPLTFLQYAHEAGAGGVQVAIGVKDDDYCRKLRETIERSGLYLEAQSSLPSTDADGERFERELVSATKSGGTILRTAMLGGRRYEIFNSAADFDAFAKKSWNALVRAEPLARKHRIKIAIENHKDWLIPDLVGILRKISSEYVGICVDTGNSIALLEDPMEVVEAYAPWAFSTHIKDMAVADFEDGFLLFEVPLGKGILDLKAIIARIEAANPQIRWNLEMITRDPLKIPYLKDKYWATFAEMPASQLAKAVAFLRQYRSKVPLPQTTGLSNEQKRELEDQNVRESLGYARTHLGL